VSEAGRRTPLPLEPLHTTSHATRPGPSTTTQAGSNVLKPTTNLLFDIQNSLESYVCEAEIQMLHTLIPPG
jgi:hypothetical protein